MKTFIKILIGSVVLGVVAWGGATWLDNDFSASVERVGGSESAPVIVAPVREEPEELRLDAVGTSRALRSVSLFPETAGQVVAVRFDSGQRVAQGDLLLELESRDERLALELADIQLRDAQQLSNRYSTSGGIDAVPINDRQASQTALAAARVERDRAQLALDDRFVRAPFAGMVGIRDIDVGDRVDPSILITTLDDRSELLVRFELPEAMLGAAQAGQEVAIASWNRPDDILTGELVDVGSRIDPVSRTIAARARVPNAQDELRPGMSFRVGLTIAGNVYPTVPEISVLWGAEGPYLWSVEENVAQRTPLRIVQRRQGRVLIDTTLATDDLVVVEGLQSMREGRTVDIVDTLNR